MRVPKHLSKEARQLWKNIIGEYDGWGTTELSVLLVGLEAHDRMRQAQKQLKKEGLVFKHKYGVKPHPCVMAERDSRTAYLNALKQLGIGSDRRGPGRPSAAVA